MSKFETVNTLMYKFLIDDLEEQIFYCRERIDILNSFNDFVNVNFESENLIELEEKLSNLKKYLSIETKIHCNRPSYIEISHFDNFGNKISTDELNSLQLDDSDYYYKNIGIKLTDWRFLSEGSNYYIGNLTFKVVDGILYSKYIQETMWYPLDDTCNYNKIFFDSHGDKEFYSKNIKITN